MSEYVSGIGPYIEKLFDYRQAMPVFKHALKTSDFRFADSEVFCLLRPRPEPRRT